MAQPLHCSKDGHFEIVKFLIVNNAYVNVPIKNDWTSIPLAACQGHFKIMQLLIENSANLNAINDKKSLLISLSDKFCSCFASYSVLKFSLID